MANLRILQVTVVDATNITATFTATLTEEIVPANITISSQTPGVPIPEVLTVSVSGTTLNITTQPLTPLADYFITFQSITGSPFQSLNGTAFILNDGVTNRVLITGPVGTDNPIKTYLNNFLQNNLYNLEAPSNVANYIDALSTVLAQGLYDIRQVKNENYLSYTIVDEQHQRGSGAFDRLNEEAAYEITRVGTTPTGTTSTSLTNIPSFPTYPISLLAAPFSENLLPSSKDATGVFNVETLTLDLSNQNVIILNSVVFVYNGSSYTYDIDGYGYQILTSEYDPDYASTYLSMASNQIILSSSILSDPNFSIEGIMYVEVSYQYKDTGRNIDPTTLSIDTVLQSSREVVPPLETVFNLDHAPVVSVSDQPGSVGDVVFIDPNAYPGSNTPHPAFINELPFTLNYLPSIPGQYSVDYTSGTVYVYGASSNDGTGAYPPLATYSYRYVFSPLIDYTYETDTQDIAYLPNGSLAEADANVSYSYEAVLAQGVDYKVSSHVEVLEEFINNNLVALNAIQPQNFPITDVFRIYNQTTGEIYGVSRWNDTTIYFTYVNAPNIQTETYERANFLDVLNEVMFVNTTSIVSGSTALFTIDLNNNNLIGSSQDCMGSSINTSVSFSDPYVFVQEIYFDNNLSLSENQSRLTNVGDYQVDYTNGVVYLLTSATQSIAIGTISYKTGYIVPQFNNIITVQDIYYQFSSLTQKLKTFPYTSFTYNSILPSSFDMANEEFLNDNTAYPYQLLNNQVGTFGDLDNFTAGVSDPVKYVRGLYEYQDLLNNTQPVNFASACSVNGSIITVNPLVYSEYHTVAHNNDGYYITANSNLLYQSPNITLTVSIVRLSDGAQLWSASHQGTVILGSPVQFVLDGYASPHLGDAVSVIYTYTINNISRIVVDYDKGGYYIDYTYLADEIVISYEYGDNALDFRQSSALYTGETYYVSYKVGALRDALLKNFGTLINIPILNNLDLTLPRENYRDALMAAMQSFPIGPSLTSMRNIVQTIVHTPPDIIESAFQNWTIGYSLLNPEPINTTGTFNLVPAKYGNGVVVDTRGQKISFPMSSNLRLEQGTLEFWVNPQWNGIDNQSDITFTVMKDGYLVPPQSIFIGPAGYHPSYGYGSNTFTLNTQNLASIQGQPNESRDGVFIYYSADQSGTFNRWFIDIKDGYWDGYSDGYTTKNYTINVQTSGQFYDTNTRALSAPSNSSSTITSSTNSLVFSASGQSVAQGITFVADNYHYLLDAGKLTKNRFSIYKDESGYLNFRVIDSFGNASSVSADISSWVAGELRQIATAWKLNNASHRDELHLFIDGFEVPNIIKYGGNVIPYLSELYRTVDPEEIVGMVHKSIVGSNDLTTTAGSNVVSSFLNFSAYSISPGDTIFIDSVGFSPLGYTIVAINGQSLVLNQNLAITMTGGVFSINQTSFDVHTDINLYPNVAISLIHSLFSAADLVLTENSDVVSSPSSNFIADGIVPGMLIQIDFSGLEMPDQLDNPDGYGLFTVVQVMGATELAINQASPISASNVPFIMYANSPEEIPGVNATKPSYSISQDGYCNNILTLTNSASPNDIVLINTFGLNNRGVNQSFYVWGSSNNLLMTNLPSPASLCNAEITHYLLSATELIYNPNNGNLVYDGYGNDGYAMDGYTIDQPSLSDNGRTLSVYIGGTNINYADTVSCTINGMSGGASVSTTLYFTTNESLNTAIKFSQVSSVSVHCTPINPSMTNLGYFYISEAYPITTAENSITVPAIRYSYQILSGSTLSGIAGSNTVSDAKAFFSHASIGDYLVITSPSNASGQYQIESIGANNNELILTSNLPHSFTDGYYQILDTTDYRSGLQNGFFTFEYASVPGKPYPLAQGSYQLQYPTYLSIPFDATRANVFVGTDVNGNNRANATIDELVILSEQLSDTRIGESLGLNQDSITKDFNSLIPRAASPSTLMISHFDSLPFTNNADTYTTATNQYIQSSDAINDNFGKSIVITDTPLTINNAGILNTPDQGSIEFWVSPLYDTGNDPNYRFYFDATAIISYETVSVNNATVKTSGQIGSVLNVKLLVGDAGVDYFAGGSIDPDGQTIYLNRALPNQQTPVIINYIPQGTQGDRLSIYKDPLGNINFNVNASGISYLIQAPVFWPANSWHRLKATFQFNEGIGYDQTRFFIDGYERGSFILGEGLLFGQNQEFSTIYQEENTPNISIQFKDTINEFSIGSDYTGIYNAYALFNNLRISNIARPIFQPFGEPIDVNYSTNLASVFPVASDLYTTLLLNFNSLVQKNTMFSTLKNKFTGQFDFTVNIFDSFGIVASNTLIKTILETLIDTLKPANTQAVIQYLTS